MTELAIGIDLGTTYSLIAHINAAGRPEIIRDAEGSASVPSVVYCGCDPPLVGKAAKEMQAAGEEEIGAFFKRSMGDSQFLLRLGGRDWSPVDLSALVLAELKRNAESVLGQPITQAVITVPAYFHNQQREATISAGRQAGLEVRKIINEPTAAALAYGLHTTALGGRVMVYDLGGGTFDVSLVQITPEEVQVLATTGDHSLGGKDWDDRIASFLAERFSQLHGVDPLDDNVSFHELLTRAETAKKALSAREAVPVTIQHAGRRETLELTRAKLEELTRDLLERTQQLVERVLEEVKLRWSDLTGVLLVGGSTRMRMVHEYVAQMSGKPPMTGVNVDEAVALGAAIQAGMELEAVAASAPLGLSPGARQGAPKLFLAGRRTIRDVTAHSLGVIAESSDRSRFINSVIVPRNTVVPAEGQRDYQCFVLKNNVIECTVYVTEGDSDKPNEVAVRGKYLCSGVTGKACKTASNSRRRKLSASWTDGWACDFAC